MGGGWGLLSEALLRISLGGSLYSEGLIFEGGLISEFDGITYVQSNHALYSSYSVSKRNRLS